MKIAAAYIRVSTDDQIEYSPASQLEKIREYAQRNGYILPQEYIFADEGLSGRHTEKRPEFNRMIGIAKQKPKPFDAILLWKFSRFARNREDSIVYKSMLRKQCGIDVISISENIGDDKMSILIEAMIEAMDEYYSINLAEEVKRGMNEKVNRGEAITIPSFGYDIKNGMYVPNAEATPVVQEIFNDFLDGIGMRAIAAKLNDRGLRTRRGNLFENRTVEYILKNPVYIGKLRWTPDRKSRETFDISDTMIVDGRHEAIIDMATWQAVQRKLSSSPKVKYMRSSSPVEPFMLQGLVRCSNCGSTLCMSAKHSSLQCHAYAHGRCKISHSITIKKINKMLIESIEKSALTGICKININLKSTTVNNSQSIINTIARERKRLERIKDAYENGLYTLDEFRIKHSEIDSKIALLEGELAERPDKDPYAERRKLNDKSLDIIPALKSSSTPEEEKSCLIKSFIEKIIFYRAACDLDIFLYS